MTKIYLTFVLKLSTISALKNTYVATSFLGNHILTASREKDCTVLYCTQEKALHMDITRWSTPKSD